MCCLVVVQASLFLTMLMGEKRGEEEEEKKETRAQPEPNKKQTHLGEETPLASLLTDVDTKRIVPKHRNKNQGKKSH